MAGSLDVDKRQVVNSGGLIYSTTSMNPNKCGGHEPPDVFCGLASLIVEGRVPRRDGGKDGREVYHEEGPHALKHYGPNSSLLHGHLCSADDYMCKKDENFRKHMLLLWQNNVPVSIEVLLCSDCRVGQQKANSVEYSTIPEPGSILLEQWTVSISNNLKRKEQKTTSNSALSLSNVDQNAITARGLFQAVRSYLHFSQLSAWYDSFRGLQPSSVLYRITIPGETFSSKFNCQPEQHYFPPAAVGSMALVNVAVRSYPRKNTIPKVLCTHNTSEMIAPPLALVSSSSSRDTLHSDSPSISPTCSSNANIKNHVPEHKSSTQTNTFVEENKLAIAGASSWREADRIEPDLRKMTLVKNKLTECTLSNPSGLNATLPRSDSMDSMLGDSLLDPPQDLQKMPPKRYQSPSRCGSPSIEAPDHLLFRSHCHLKEKADSLQTNGEISNSSESARNRLARQDLLRRRDIGQTLGISGPCHGLHPRMLLNVGQHQPRLSLPPKPNAAIASPVMSTTGPYRAFPPERGMHQFSPYIERSSHHDIGISEDIEQVSSLFDKMQVKCNISGKHICNYEAKQEGLSMTVRYDSCCNSGDRLINDGISRDKEDHNLNKPMHSDTINIENRREEATSASMESSKVSKEPTPSFTLGGAKKKSAISINRVKKNEHSRTTKSKRRHYKDIESDDDTGMEVAEYEIDENENAKLASIQTRYDSANMEHTLRQTAFQKELDEIFDGLAPKKNICTSRRSSIKDEDQLFPHKCKCTRGVSQSKLDILDPENSKTAFYRPPNITQVYRAETEAQQPLVSPLSVHSKFSKKNDEEPNVSVPSKALDKADILLGAIMRTSERNKHLETDDEVTTDSLSSSRDDSYSVGCTKKTPEARKVSAGDADDEDEGNTSSDNGSSILSSPTSSDEEEPNFQRRAERGNLRWYKKRSNDLPERSTNKKIFPTLTSGKKSSDSSSSQCSSCEVSPTKSSILQSLANDLVHIEPVPPADYARIKNFCDKESGHSPVYTIYKENESTSGKICKMDNQVIREPTEQILKTFHHSSNSFRPTNECVQISKCRLECQDDSDTKENEEYPDFEIPGVEQYYRSTASSSIRTRTMSENLHTVSTDSKIKDLSYFDSNGSDMNKIKKTAATTTQIFDTDTWFDDNYGIEYLTKEYRGNGEGLTTGVKNQITKETPDSALRDELLDAATNNMTNCISIPTGVQKDYFRKTLNSATSMVFHRKSGLPLSSSPAPLRRGKNDFGYDASINTPKAIKRALYPTSYSGVGNESMTKTPIHSLTSELNSSDRDDGSQDIEDIATEEPDNFEFKKSSYYGIASKRQNKALNEDDIFSKKRHRSSKEVRMLSASAPATVSSQGTTANNLLGTFEESVLNGRLEPVSTVEGFSAEIGASGSFHPKHKTVPVTVFFYNMCCDNSPSISSPYLGHINLGKKGYRVPQSGTIQVTLFNPLGTVVKMFVVMYDLSDMPPNSQTFIRQRTFYMPTSDSMIEIDEDSVQKGNDGSIPVGASPKWLRYLIHLRFASSKSGKIYLHTDVRMIIFRKSDLDTAADHNTTPGKLGGFELRSFTNGPSNPKFSPRKISFRQEE